MTSFPEMGDVDELFSERDSIGFEEVLVFERTLKFKTVMATTPREIRAAAAMAMRADILRIIFFWLEDEEEGEEELGLRTMGFGRMMGHEMLRIEPQRDGFPERDEEGMELKKVESGMSPEKRLLEMLKERRLGRWVRNLGRLPLRRFVERSRVWR